MSAKKCSDKHDVLYHYTTMEGFRKIIETQTLWATHYKHLNDSSELVLFTSVLPNFLVPAVKKVIKKFRAAGLPVKRIIDKVGSRHDLARHEAERLSEVLFDGAFLPIKNNPKPLFEPFITSFCSHLEDNEYTRNHGLLSMWRSYGMDGGISIVMDTAILEEHINRESNEFGHLFISVGDVIYEGDNDKFNSEFGHLIELVKEKLTLFYKEEDVTFADVLEPYLSCVTRLKHQAFKEEREVRIITMPWNGQSLETESRENKKDKQEHTRPGNHEDIRFLALFDGETVPRLPIKRIIVGPHSEQQERYEEIKQATKHIDNIEVTCSETPLIER